MILRTAFAVLLGLSASVVSRASITTNGGFETGDFSGWTVGGYAPNFEVGVCTNGSTFGGAANCTSNSGTYAAALGPDQAPATLSQDLATTAGLSYTVSFALRSDGGGADPSNSFQVSFNGQDLIANPVNLPATDGYTQYLFTNLLATSDSTPLEFTMQNVPGGFFLDDVTVDPTPEPASLFLVAGSLGVAGLVRRKRKNTAVNSAN